MIDLTARLSENGLRVSGVLTPEPADGLAERFKTLVLISPSEPAFWDMFSASSEALDGAPDPVDRWSRRVIGSLACDLGGKAYFPFGGPPHRPFYSWALRSGSVAASPVSLLVDGTAGLFVSFRGALALPDDVETSLPPPPCNTCIDRPCTTACPASALNQDGYNVPACHRWLDTPNGETCLAGGCLVRRACPVGAANRPEQQSSYFMRQFHK